ncbi:MAG TPA: hypothetical protein VN132_09790, partial [Bdellovibrio sp.]|nr:hypothetical protein [Bdellovibrio sp.]
QNLLEKVKEQDAQYFTKHQRPMTNTQLRDYLEQLRVDDLENFKEGDPSLIHEFLRPDNVIAKPPHREVN